MSQEQAALELYSEVIGNLIRRRDEVDSFRRIVDLGSPGALRQIREEGVRFAQRILVDPQFDKYFSNRAAMVAFLGGPEEMGKKKASDETAKFRRSVDAASLVLMHSAVDAALSDLCRVTLRAQPTAWDPFIAQKSISIGELTKRGIETIGAELRERAVEASTRESILFRTRRLFMLCRPKDPSSLVAAFRYDEDRLIEIDEARQRVVHGSAQPPEMPNCQQDLEYLFKCGLYFFAMVHHGFGLKIDPMLALGMPRPPSNATRK